MAVQSLNYFLCLGALWVFAWPLRNARYRQLLLLAASWLFYATWGIGFLAVLVASSLLNYFWAIMLRRNRSVRWLWGGIVLNLALLFFFKYLPGRATTLPAVIVPFDSFLRIAMPIGISFWTFEALSYLFDIYRGEQCEPTLSEFCLYMAFWPTVLSGPVCRMPDMLGQFRSERRPGGEDLAAGAHRIVIGLFMKLVLAQIVAAGIHSGSGVDFGFDQLGGNLSGLDVWMLALGFGFQLWFDFAGYSHIVIGSARLFGIRVAENFDRPYVSQSPSLFWTRWHMSLSFWIRDYLFFPLAARRRALWWRYLALAASMVVFGLWHGATLPFVAWGAYHGLLLVGHRLLQSLRKRLNLKPPAALDAFLSCGVTFALVSLGWIFFRSHSISRALAMLRAVLTPHGYFRQALQPDYYLIVALCVAGYFVFELARSWIMRFREQPRAASVLWFAYPVFYAACLILIIRFSSQESPFVYFQF